MLFKFKHDVYNIASHFHVCISLVIILTTHNSDPLIIMTPLALVYTPTPVLLYFCPLRPAPPSS